MDRKLNCAIFFVLLLFSVLPVTAKAQISDDSQLNPVHATILGNWLETKPNLKLAFDKDYTKSALDSMRQQYGPNFLPYYVAEDSNKNGSQDFAVILITRQNKKKFYVAIFNAPFLTRKLQQPAYFSNGIELDDALFFNKETKKLLVGPFESDAGFILRPKGKTYAAIAMLDEE